MAEQTDSESRKLLQRLRDTLAEDSAGQERLDHIVEIIATSMQTEVCSIYLFRDAETLELCATEGLNPDAVHQTRLRLGEGLVGRAARDGQVVNEADAPSAKGFRFMPETGEEVCSSFCGVPITRLGHKLGVLVVQSRDARNFSDDEIYALEVVAMVLAEMTELGAFVGEGEALKARHTNPMLFRGGVGQEGVAEGHVWLHEPRVVVSNPVADDPEAETERLRQAVDELRVSVDDMLKTVSHEAVDKDQREVLEAYRMFAASRSWLKRMEESIAAGLSAEAAVEKEQSTARSRLGTSHDAYLRERLQDLDDLSNRLLRILTGQYEEAARDAQQALDLSGDRRHLEYLGTAYALAGRTAEARAVLRQKYFEAEVGITGANMLIAETGQSIIVTNEGNGDLSQSLPKVHIVLASLEKIVPTMEDAATVLRVLARSATGQEMSVYTTLSSGPRSP